MEKQKYYSPSTTIIMIINVMLGTGPIIIPPIFLLAGIGLSSIWMIVIGFLSYLASEMIVESISLCNAIKVLNAHKNSAQKVKLEKQIKKELENDRISKKIEEIEHKYKNHHVLGYNQMDTHSELVVHTTQNTQPDEVLSMQQSDSLSHSHKPLVKVSSNDQLLMLSQSTESQLSTIQIPRKQLSQDQLMGSKKGSEPDLQKQMKKVGSNYSINSQISTDEEKWGSNPKMLNKLSDENILHPKRSFSAMSKNKGLGSGSLLSKFADDLNSLQIDQVCSANNLDQEDSEEQTTKIPHLYNNKTKFEDLMLPEVNIKRVQEIKQVIDFNVNSHEDLDEIKEDVNETKPEDELQQDIEKIPSRQDVVEVDKKIEEKFENDVQNIENEIQNDLSNSDNSQKSNNNNDNNNEKQKNNDDDNNNNEIQVEIEAVEEKNVEKSDEKKKGEDLVDFGVFSMKDVYEYQDIGKHLLGRNGQIVCGFLVCIYIYGVIVSKCIMTGSIMSDLFQGISVLDNYYFWLGLFFSCSAVLSFKDVSSITSVQNFVGAVRFFALILLVVVPIYIILSDGKVNQLTEFSYTYESNVYDYKIVNFGVFAELFSNLTFAYLVQHSIGALVGNNRPESSMKKIMGIVYLIAILSTFLIAIIAIMAFGGELTDPYDEGGIKYYNTMFKGRFNVVYYFTSFYIFLNVAALPVLTIVLRNNAMKLITPEKFPKKSYELTNWTLVYTSVILFFVLLCSISMKNHIQYVLNVTGGMCGVVIMLIMPILFVICGRRKVQELQKEVSNFELNKHRAKFTNKVILYGLLGVSFVLFGYNIYLSGMKFINGGGGH